jgi:hypothetical protein
MERLQITTLIAQDISSPLLVATYTADQDREILVQLYLSGLTGSGACKACLTKQLLGAGTAYQSPTSAVILSAAVTTAYLPTAPLPVNATDVVKIYVEGLAGDTSAGVVTEVFDVTATAIDPLTAQETRDAVLLADWEAITGEVPDRSMLNALRFLRNKWTAINGELTVYEEDDATEAWTALLTTNSSADRITGSAPE